MTDKRDNTGTCICIFFILVILVLIYQCYCSDNSTYQRWYNNKIDTYSDKLQHIQVGLNKYKVHENLDNAHSAAELMDKINRNAKKIIYHLNDTFINHKDGYENIKEEFRDKVITGINNLNNNFKTENLVENIPNKIDKDTSYVIDKGDVFALCLRDVNNNNSLSIDMNEITFVLVHEMSHIFTISYGHEFEFWSNFKFMLNEVFKMGLYTPVNYKLQKKPYCGIHISYSPLYDRDLPDYLYAGNFVI